MPQIQQVMGPSQEHTTEHNTPFSIPKLSLDGSNWVTFKTCFLFTMGGHNIEGHFDGNDAYLVAVRKWQHNKKIACAQLAQVMSDSLFTSNRPRVLLTCRAPLSPSSTRKDT